MKLSVVNFRLKPDEERILREKAAIEKMNISDYCRSRILSENVPRETPSNEEEKTAPFLNGLNDLKNEVEIMRQDIQTNAKNTAVIAAKMNSITEAVNGITSRIDNLTKTVSELSKIIEEKL